MFISFFYVSLHYQFNNLNNKKMENNTHTHILTFSLRDWKKGSELLEKLGHNDNMNLTDQHHLSLNNWEEDVLLDELTETGLEWILRDEKGTGTTFHSNNF